MHEAPKKCCVIFFFKEETKTQQTKWNVISMAKVKQTVREREREKEWREQTSKIRENRFQFYSRDSWTSETRLARFKGMFSVPKFPLSIRPKVLKHMEMIITSVHVKCKLATVIAVAFYFFCFFFRIFSCVLRLPFLPYECTSLALLCRLGNIRYRRPLLHHTWHFLCIFYIYSFRLVYFCNWIPQIAHISRCSHAKLAATWCSRTFSILSRWHKATNSYSLTQSRNILCSAFEYWIHFYIFISSMIRVLFALNFMWCLS